MESATIDVWRKDAQNADINRLMLVIESTAWDIGFAHKCFVSCLELAKTPSQARHFIYKEEAIRRLTKDKNEGTTPEDRQGIYLTDKL